jgi:CubicO group peptidase (beta-lactamase class C family)
MLSLPELLEDLKPTIERICKLTGNVGASFGVLCHGEIIFAAGVGYRDLEQHKIADADTLYNIASCTKAFTATACALLVKDGILELDVPIKRYVPEIRDDEITLTDLLSHRTGYARLDPSWVGANGQFLVTHADFLERVNGLPRAKPLRSDWLYNNWMYALVGEIIGRKGSEGTWEQFMERRVFPKFGMTRSCIRKEYIPDDNITLSYASTKSGKAMIVPQPRWEESPFAAGGGILSSVNEMLRWAGFLLEAYAFERHPETASFAGGAKISHPGVIFDPRMALPDQISSGQLERTYAFGFQRLTLPAVLNPYGRNHTVAENVPMPCVGSESSNILVLSHSGENVGALSSLTLLPDVESAVVVLGNTTALGDATDLIAQVLIQEVLGLSNSQDFITLTESIVRECSGWFERTIQSPLVAHRILGTAAGAPSDYVGTYRDRDTGAVISITLEDRKLFFHRGGLASQRALLEHYHNETFSFATSSYDEHMQLGLIDYDNWEQLLIEFERGVTGEVVAAKWMLDQDLPPFFFKRCLNS